MSATPYSRRPKHPILSKAAAVGAACAAALALLWGCVNIGSSTYDQIEPGDIPEQVTYAEHVAPIVEFRCGACHFPGGSVTEEAPLYGTYESVAPPNWRAFKRTTITDMTMPPGGKERTTPRENAILVRWESEGFAR
jgi:hypothetical protein